MDSSKIQKLLIGIFLFLCSHLPHWSAFASDNQFSVSERADCSLLQRGDCRMLIEDMVYLGDDHGDVNTGVYKPGLGNEGRVGKDGKADVLLSCNFPVDWPVHLRT